MLKRTKKKFQKQAIIGAVTVLTLSVSGLLPIGAAFAQGELVAELVAQQGGIISGKPGETILVPVNIHVSQFGSENHSTSAVTVTANFEGNPVKTVFFNANEFNVKKQLQLEYTIPNTTAATVTPRVVMSSTDLSGNDKVVDEKYDTVTINVVQAPPAGDSIAPIVSLTNQINGFYNANTLPGTFQFNLDEAAEVFVNGVSQGSFTSGSHVLALPASKQGINSVTLAAKDAAGNESTPVIFTYFYDTINPLVTPIADSEANTHGWYNKDVVVSFAASDLNGSGVASFDPPVTVSTEGENQIITGNAQDNAGNVGSGSITLNIDKTNPTISGNPDRGANSYGWYNNDVTVSFEAADTLSGVASFTDPVKLVEGANQSVTGIAIDRADNDTSTTVYGINIDKTDPTISGQPDREANSYGWYNDDVTVSFLANDTLSGVASYTGSVPLGEGADQSVTGTAIDKADNDTLTTVYGINIDKTAPVIVFDSVNDGDQFTLNQVVNWSASDNLSGLATESSGTVDTSKVGTYKITAKDKAGNTVVKNYSVVYNFSGILQPINKDGSSIFKAGSTVPVKFQLTDSQGAFISTANATIYYAKYSNQVLGNEAEAVSTSASTSGNLFRYDPISNQYIFNLSTKGLTPGSYLITIKLDDETTQQVKFCLK
ncbi:PxKF domain-containing protein [Bacillus sp. 7884-1]|uniref:PxKF domain-containing protein n=1 Tax=Bacillus sp. 7884-1 TaxID=2021693 RepID=UPI000BA6E4F1|nr:PxKF domain-containing protein [Bacillus sp. 7884-1]PAE40109.1 hypothetical protein CHI06_15410 [Bacillus sp. 7884-1]